MDNRVVKYLQPRNNIYIQTTDGVTLVFPEDILVKSSKTFRDMLLDFKDTYILELNYTSKQVAILLDFIDQKIIPNTIEECIELVQIADFMEIDYIDDKNKTIDAVVDYTHELMRKLFFPNTGYVIYGFIEKIGGMDYFEWPSIYYWLTHMEDARKYITDTIAAFIANKANMAAYDIDEFDIVDTDDE